MKQYASFFKIRVINGLQYRAAAWAGVATQYAWGFLFLLMYRAFYRSGQNAFPMTFPQLSSYIWLQQAFLALNSSWYFDEDIMSSITNGNVAYELCRPNDLYTMWFVKNAAVRVSRVILRCFPILLVAVLLPKPYNISPPVSPAAGCLFLISMILGLMVLVSFSMLIYITTFYTLSPLGIRILAVSVVEFLAGGVIPLPFFPESLQSILYLLPFASMQNTPYQIYNGFFSWEQILINILLQIFWLSALLFAGKRLMKQALTKVVVQGG